ncbi:MAG: hypothetical protein ACK56I_12865, partial [bacterium]
MVLRHHPVARIGIVRPHLERGLVERDRALLGLGSVASNASTVRGAEGEVRRRPVVRIRLARG